MAYGIVGQNWKVIVQRFFPTRNVNQVKCKVQYLIVKGRLKSRKEGKEDTDLRDASATKQDCGGIEMLRQLEEILVRQQPRRDEDRQ